MSVYDERYHIHYARNLNFYTSDPAKALSMVNEYDDAWVNEGYGACSNEGYTYRKNLGPLLASTLEFIVARTETLALLARLTGQPVVVARQRRV